MHHPWIHQFLIIFAGLPSLKACRRYSSKLVHNQPSLMCAFHVCTCAVWHTPAWSTWAHHCPVHVVHIHSQQAALCSPCETTKLKKCSHVHAGLHQAREGSIPGCWPDSPELFTWPHIILSPLPLTVLVKLRSSDGSPKIKVPISCPDQQKKSPGKFLWCTPTAETSGSFRKNLENSKDEGGGAMPAQGFFHLGARYVGAVTPAIPLAENRMQGMWAGLPSGVTAP